MKRAAKCRLLLAIALCHLFGDMAFAGSAILCIGANDHRAVEMEHLAGQDCENTALASPSPIEATAPESEACSDSPLHPDAEHLSSSESTGADAAALLLQVADHTPLVQRGSSTLRARARAPTPPPGLGAIRSTVLLI